MKGGGKGGEKGEGWVREREDMVWGGGEEWRWSDKLFFGKNVVIVSAMQILPRSAWIVTHRASGVHC